MNNDEEIKEVVNRLSEALDNLDKTVNSMNKTMDKMISYCGLMLLVLFATIVLAIVF